MKNKKQIIDFILGIVLCIMFAYNLSVLIYTYVSEMRHQALIYSSAIATVVIIVITYVIKLLNDILE